jgi:hypothetical protein
VSLQDSKDGMLYQQLTIGPRRRDRQVRRLSFWATLFWRSAAFGTVRCLGLRLRKTARKPHSQEGVAATFHASLDLESELLWQSRSAVGKSFSLSAMMNMACGVGLPLRAHRFVFLLITIFKQKVIVINKNYHNKCFKCTRVTSAS